MHSEREATPVTLQQERTRLRKEITLLRTLAVTVVAFVVCWMSYGVVVMFFAPTVPPRVKKVKRLYLIKGGGILGADS